MTTTSSNLAEIEIIRLLMAALFSRTACVENAFFEADEVLEHHIRTRKVFIEEFGDYLTESEELSGNNTTN